MPAVLVRLTGGQLNLGAQREAMRNSAADPPQTTGASLRGNAAAPAFLVSRNPGPL